MAVLWQLIDIKVIRLYKQKQCVEVDKTLRMEYTKHLTVEEFFDR